jgi:putative peptidoglycan lipid II flippase
LAITALLSNGLGLIRNALFYRVLPPDQLDVYFASFRIADFLLNILIIGAISSAVIPIVSELLAKEKEEKAWKLTSQLLSLATLTIFVIIVVLVIAMPYLMHIIVPGFDAAQMEATTRLSRLLLIQTLFFSWSIIIGALLNSYSRFTTYAFAPLVYNSSLIIGGIAAGHFGVNALVYSVIIGSFFHFLIQYYEVRKVGFDFHFLPKFSPEIKRILSLMAPRSLSQGMAQIVLLVYTNLASTMQRGSLSIFSGMNDLQTTPVVIVANSLATAFFPSLVAHMTKEKWDDMNSLITKVIKMSLFIMLPIVALSLILRAQIVRLYLATGGVGWDLTTIAITTFAWFIVGIVPAALVVILTRVFYASHDTRTPMIINIATSLAGIGFSMIMIRNYNANVSVLAMSETLISTSQCLFYLVILHYRSHLNIHFKEIASSGLTYGLGAGFLAACSWTALYLIDNLYGTLPWIGTDRILGLLIQAAVAGAVGILAYFGYSTIRSKEEIQWLKKRTFS